MPSKKNIEKSQVMAKREATPSNSRLIDFSYAGVYRNEQKPVLPPDQYEIFYN